jgi:hypothetical protein
MISRSEVPTAEPFERRVFLAGGPLGVERDDFAAARCINFIPISPLDIVLGVFPDMLA